jgi:vancomycin permeability regulator SanA
VSLPRFALGGAAFGAAGIVVVTACAGFVRSAARDRLRSEADVPGTPVALVLGAQVYPDGTPSPFLAARLEVARRLFETGKVTGVLVSGDSLAPEHDEPTAMRRYLLDAGLPATSIEVDRHGFDTYESCLRARDVFGLSRLTLVSQAYHLPRAVGTARRLGLDAYGVGDWSVREIAPGQRSRTWRLGALRDAVACVKTVIDLAVRRRPARLEAPRAA